MRNQVRKISATIAYCIVFGLLLSPWFVVDGQRITLLRLALNLKGLGISGFISEYHILCDSAGTLSGALKINLAAYLILAILSLFYLVTVWAGRKWYLNIGAMFVSIMLAFTVEAEYMIHTICENRTQVILYPMILLVITALEAMIQMVIDHWDEIRGERKENAERDRRLREEKKRRLLFQGNYPNVFYRIVRNNFCNSGKDYVLLWSANALVFCVILLGFSVATSLGLSGMAATGVLTGAEKTLFQGLVFIGLVGVCMLVLLLLYYLKKRVVDYGVFHTLGIRRKTLYLCMGLELGFGAVVSLLIGTGMEMLLGFFLGLAFPGMHLLKALGVMAVLYLITFFVTHDLFTGFQMGSQTDLQMKREWMPGKYFLVGNGVALGILAFSLFLYRQTAHFENYRLMLLGMFSLYLFLRINLAWFYHRWKGQKGKVSGLLQYHPFFHRSRTATWYLFGLTVLQICILGIFGVQLYSAKLVEDAEKYFPYDMVCLADEDGAEDRELFRRLKADYGAEILSFPMVRVSGTDATEVMEGAAQAQLRGQQIGISESTYHALKKAKDPDYREEDLGLDEEGQYIYIVHQQDKSVKAQPVDYHISKVKPFLYTGPVCEYADEYSRRTNFRRFLIAGEEMDSLIGCFVRGERENLVVFSDAYFEEARRLWETTNRYTGEEIDDLSQRIPGETTFRGPSQLVLIRMEEEQVALCEPLLQEFRERHREEEAYDALIESIYRKADAVSDMQKELETKKQMAWIMTAVFFLAGVLLILIKMLTEKNIRKRRQEFLRQIGMRKKERTALIRWEFRAYLVVSGAVALLYSGLFFAATCHARMYEAADVQKLGSGLGCFTVVEYALFAVVVCVLRERYIRSVDYEDRE